MDYSAACSRLLKDTATEVARGIKAIRGMVAAVMGREIKAVETIKKQHHKAGRPRDLSPGARLFYRPPNQRDYFCSISPRAHRENRRA